MSKPQARNLREVQDEYKEAVVGLCCVCHKPVPGWYGAWEEGGTCSGKCERIREAQPKFPDHTAEAFEKLHNL